MKDNARVIGIVGTGMIASSMAVLGGGHGFKTVLFARSQASVDRCSNAVDNFFNQMIEQFYDYDFVIFPYENEENITIKDVLRKLVKENNNINKIALVIGPEGGFSDNEAKTLADNGGISASLGKTILRSETAGLVALAMTMYELEL